MTFMTKSAAYTFCCAGILSLALVSACVKDRVGDGAVVTPGTPVSPADRELIHYWDFNSSPLLQPKNTVGEGIIQTENRYDDTDGADLNLREDSNPGNALRVRNPSTFMIVKAPTPGYKSPLLTFVVMRTNNGPKENILEYTIDGVNYIGAGLVSNKVNVTPDWAVYSIDFAGIAGVDDNPLFAIRFTFSVGNTNDSGNDRYDNISIDAYPL